MGESQLEENNFVLQNGPTGSKLCLFVQESSTLLSSSGIEEAFYSQGKKNQHLLETDCSKSTLLATSVSQIAVPG